MASNRCSSNDAMILIVWLDLRSETLLLISLSRSSCGIQGRLRNPGIVDCVSALALIESAPSGAANGPCDP
jgi:hypothetical protein